MDCKIGKSRNGKINKVLDAAGNISKLFQEILNIPTLSLNDAIQAYQNIYGSKLKDKVQFQIVGQKGAQKIEDSKNTNIKVTEPNLTLETPTGEIFNNYQEALQNTDYGTIKLKIDDVVIGEVDSDTNVDTFEGTINHLVKQGGLTGERILDVNGDIIYVTKGKTEGAKHIASELVEKQAVRLLGQSGVINTTTGDFILKNTLNKATINGEEYDKKDIDDLNYDQLVTKFGKETALEIEFSREYVKALQPTKTKKVLDEIVEIKSEDELVSAIKTLLNRLGIKVTSIDSYIKNNTLKNNDVAPEAKALMDLVNKVIAFRNGSITREDLIEETMHLIEATLDTKQTEGVRRNIHKTAEWKQYAEYYRTLYSKEYSGEKLDEMVRREILGKVMANAVMNNFALSQEATLAEQSIFEKIKEFLQQFFDGINNFFRPEYQKQIDSLNNDIYAKLMSGSLLNEMDLDQNFGTKFRLYSASTNVSNDVVRLQKEAEKALGILRSNVSNIESKDPSQNQMLQSAKALLKKVGEKVDAANDVEARVEAIATFAKVLNVVEKQVKYLERVVKKSTQNKHPFSAEEMIVYNNLVNEFGKMIIPVVDNVLRKEIAPTTSEKRLIAEVEKAQANINTLVGKVENSGYNAKDYVVDLLVNRLGLDAETEKFLRERANSQQVETNWFFEQFGNLSHSSNVYLNALGHVVTKVDFDKRQGFQQNIKSFISKLSGLGLLEGRGLSTLADGNYIQSAHDFKEIEKVTNVKRYDLFYEILNVESKNPTIKPDRLEVVSEILKKHVKKGEDGYEQAVEEFAKADIIDSLDHDGSVEFDKQMELWSIHEYKLSPLNAKAMEERRNKLSKYSKGTQEYMYNSSLTYSAIMQEAEIVDDIPQVTEAMRSRIESTRKLKNIDKNIFDQEGNLRKGLLLSTKAEYEAERNLKEEDKTVKKIDESIYVVFSKDGNGKIDVDSDAILAVELNLIDNERIEESKKEVKNDSGLTDKFKKALSKLDGEEAYNFLMLNSYVGYNEEYYNDLGITKITERLEASKSLAENEEYDVEIDNLINAITLTNKKIGNVLRANRMMNHPSETNFDGMDFYEVDMVRRYSQELEQLYSESRRYLPKQEQEEMEKEEISETISNRAFLNYLLDTQIVGAIDYSGKTELTADEKNDISKIFKTVEDHTTENKRKEILNLKATIKGFISGKATKLTKSEKRVFKLTEEEYAKMSEKETEAYMTNELLQYSYTRVLPYFKKSLPKGVDRTLVELEAGILSASDFIKNYESGAYQYLKITPNYNFQEVTEDNNKNPHFQLAKLNSTPMFRLFEAETTLDDVRTKSVDQLKQEGKLNKYANTKFLNEYGIDMVELFTTGKEVAKNNVKMFEARQSLLDLQKESLTKLGVLGKHNLYMLPQKEASKTRKFEGMIKSKKGARAIIEEIVSFREDEAEYGQTDGKVNVKNTYSNNSIPKFGLRKLRNAPVTDDLLESYTWMNYKANEYQARKHNIGDAIALNQALMGSEFEGNIDVKTSKIYKVFKESYDYNFYGIKETWSKQFKLFGLPIDMAKILKNFAWVIRLRNLGYTLVSPITSALTGSVFLRIESLVGSVVDKDAMPKANSFFRKYMGDAAREVLSLESKSMLNALGEVWGWYDPMERYDNTMYSKAYRGFGKSPFAAHQLANFPVNTRVGLAVLANNRFVEGQMLEFRQYKSMHKNKAEKDLRKEWEAYTSVLDVVKLSKDGVISYDYAEISKALNNNFTEEESKQFMDDKAIVIKGRIKSAIQNVDGQISTEDKSMSTRNAFFSFMNIHRSWLMIAVQNKYKGNQLNLNTGYMDVGTHRRVAKVFNDIIKDAKKSGVVAALSNIRKNYKEYDDVTKMAVKRTGWELALLNILVGLTVMAMRSLADDEDDSWLFETGSLFLFRTTNEVASATAGLPKNVYDTLENVVVGLNTLEIATQSFDLTSSDIVKRGRYKGLTERERYIYRHVPGMRDYNNLWRDLPGNIKSYNYFNFTKGGALDYMTIYPFIKDYTDANKK